MPSLFPTILCILLMFAETVAGQSIPGEISNSLGMTFQYLPPGSFTLGSPPTEPGRDPDEQQVRVTLTHGFFMQTTEVTQSQWKALMGDNPSHFTSCDDCPVESVSWEDIQRFVYLLNHIEGGELYRLPTEAEWEYASRAGSDTPFEASVPAAESCDYDPLFDRRGWYSENANGRTHPVAQKIASGWGLFDMHGNVWEWCADYYGKRPHGRPEQVDPRGPSFGYGRVFKGGGWNFPARCGRPANRKWLPQKSAKWNLGFRLVRTAQYDPGQLGYE